MLSGGCMKRNVNLETTAYFFLVIACQTVTNNSNRKNRKCATEENSEYIFLHIYLNVYQEQILSMSYINDLFTYTTMISTNVATDNVT